MRRREFIVGLGGAAVLPLAARAQQAVMPVVGFLRSNLSTDSVHLVTAFRLGLKEAGFTEGDNVAVEYRYADNQTERLPGLVADLLRRQVAVIAGNAIAMIQAKAATSTIPIVFTTGGDPIRQGLVTSFNRPSGNVTGVVFFSNLLGAKRLELLRHIFPRPTTIAVLVNPKMPNTEAERSDVQAAAQAIRQRLLVLDVSSESDIETAFATLVQHSVGGLFVGSGAFFNSHKERVIALAERHSVPAIYAWREAAMAGGLMSYASSQSDAYRQAGNYVGRILKGEKPVDLPVIQSTRFEFVINLKTARTLRINVPPTLLARADEVIE
jgi:putative ABC transport system substrate-binding protein